MKIAIIQVRGPIHLNQKLKDTLKMLKLPKKHSCVIVEGNSSYKGMITKIKDYITWGEIDEETFKMLLQRRGRVAGNKGLTEEYLKDKTKMGYDEFSKAFLEGKIKLKEVAGMKPYFRLTPPRKGFERGGIKKPFAMGGALGERKKHVNELIRRML